MTLPQRLVIATRASRLAIWQAEHVRDRLRELYPACAVELLALSTRGDQILDRTLSKVGGKGLFVKELENVLLDGRADLAVHSLKDVPVDMQPLFVLSTVLKRADPRDAFVSNHHESLQAMPAGAVVGTSSLRREAQIRAARPDLVVKSLRGNLDTRLAKLDQGEYDAVVLAAAGLERIGHGGRIRARLSPAQSLPAAGQGALGIEIRDDRDDMRTWLAPLSNQETTACVSAERAVSRELGGSCQVPLAAYAQLDAQGLRIEALVASVDGRRFVRAARNGPADQAQSLGVAVARDLLDQGGGTILAELLQDGTAP